MARVQFTSETNDPRDTNSTLQEGANISKPTRRQRWASQRYRGQVATRKRLAILNRVPGIHISPYEEKPDENHGAAQISDESPMGQEIDTTESEARTIYMNMPLPPEARDEEGHKKQHFVRNKIRTSKYTPLSFIPKNLWFQFHNVANIYFLFIIILGIFPIFGATNPALNAVPLIVILTLTAIKDAIEDWRRTVLDNDLNNSPVYRLVNWVNINSSEDTVGPWRRLKKATTRTIIKTYRAIKRLTQKKKRSSEKDIEVDSEPRTSNVSRPTIRTSIYSERQSFQSAHSEPEDIAMTSVTNSSLRHGESLYTSETLQNNSSSAANARSGPGSSAQPVASDKDHGNVINPHKEIPGTARFKKDFWKNVQVGDFLRIYNDEQVPADVVVLATSDPDGACYIETKNLDGETNLKVRHALQGTRKVQHAKDCERAVFEIESEGPHPNLYDYNGVIRWQQVDRHDVNRPSREMAEPIGINNMLLRGCSLKNTEWVLGVVIYTGRETKIMLNAGETPRKRARLARELNWNVIYNFIILVLMCLVSGIVQGVAWDNNKSSWYYFEFGTIAGSPPLDGFVTFWSAVILFQNLIPISLYISLEIVRSAQAFFIFSDTFMYYEKIDYPCTPKSWNISDDVGQIEYIFSDKTGTLTQNVMEFKKCTINGANYGEAYTEAEAGMRRRQGVDVEEESARINAQIAEDRIEMLRELRRKHDNPYLHDENLTFVAPKFVHDLNGASGEEQQRANENFMIALALCHTVITETTPGDPPLIDFKAQSPDEAALVATARDCGFTVLGRTNDDLHVNVLGQDRSYRVLNTLEFNSTRKRMSAIIRMPDGRIKLFCKGADSMIYSRLVRGQQQELRIKTAEVLEMFAREGLRTLCVAERDVSEEFYQEWSREHDLAAQALTDRADKMEEVADRIERDLMLLGGTAIEDRLQDGVPDTIALLGAAGIKLWVLTGDKVETAINIGFSCNLLSNEMDLIVFDIPEGNLEDAEQLLDQHLQTFGLTGSEEELTAARLNHEPPAPTHALVIDGESLKLVLHETLCRKFLLLCKECKAVLCCRVSPAQKAAVVRLVKNGLDIMALSIGDGANDVAMIQEADVGVGIAGEEGRQAAMSSDYAIGQFRFLQRLVLVHGRWSYRRLAETIANFFYKNIVWTFTLFWYSIFTNFDVSYLFDYSYILLFNLAFTSLPVILMGVLDQDVSDKVSLAVPQLYRRGMERLEWSQLKFWLYMVDGIYQSAILFFMTYLLFRPATFVTEKGLDLSQGTRMGVFVACAGITVINSYILLNTYQWDWLILLITAISILLVYFWTGVYSSFTASTTFYKAGAEVLGSLAFWAILLLTVTICLLPRFCIKFFQKNYRPYDVDIIREQVRQGKFDYLKQFESFVPPKAVVTSASSSDATEDLPIESGPGRAPIHAREDSMTESQRPIYPPSEAATTRTRHPHSQTGSDGTDRTKTSLDWNKPPRRPSLDRMHSSQRQARPQRPSLERAKSSLERSRQSFERMRPSFEGSRDFTSAAMLARMESAQSVPSPTSVSPVQTSRRHDISSIL